MLSHWQRCSICLWARSSRRPLEDPVEVTPAFVEGAEAARLRELHDAEVGCATAAHWTGDGGWRRRQIHRLAVLAHAQWHGRAKRVRLLTCLRSDAPVMHHSRRSMHHAVLHGLRAGCELADGDVKVAVDRIFRRPLVGTIRVVVKKQTHASWKTEHG